MLGTILSVAGGLLGAIGSKKGNSATTTQKSEPWAPVQPWLQDNIAKGQKLQAQYEAQPFSPLQQQAYGNLFSDLDNFRNNVAPGLLNWSGNAMQGGYQRQNAARPGLVGYGPSSQPQQQQPVQPQGLFAYKPAQGGMADLLNFQQPAPAAQAPAPSGLPTDAAAFDKMMQEYQRRQYEAEMNSASSNWNAGYGA